MTRRFASDQPVDPDLLRRLLAEAGRAPSAGFAQGWDFVALTTPDARERFWAAASPDVPDPRGDWLAGVRAAPVLLLALADEQAYRQRYAEPDKGATPPDDQDWPVPYWLTDTAMGALLILLGATDAGLGALFFGVPGAGHAPVKAAFGIPADRALIGVIALGHEERRVTGSAARRPRRGVADYVHWGRFGAPDPGPSAAVGENVAEMGPA